ncbi:probable ADP-ribosylation factor GTPase-activating protein AGD6 [Phalaenopsis equestris]|nr:probable ADP-ribosylation factor GTPase-activating protein AGD6 [Phalaenopsis equestris]
MHEGGYDQKMNETVSVVTAKTTEIGQKTWGIMKGVMAMASQKVEEFTKEGSNWKADDRQQTNGLKNAYYHDFGGKGSGGLPNEHSRGQYNSTSTWDDWDEKDRKGGPGKSRQNGDDWAGWDDVKDEDSDEDDKHRHSSSGKGVKSGSRWSDGGFH